MFSKEITDEHPLSTMEEFRIACNNPSCIDGVRDVVNGILIRATRGPVCGVVFTETWVVGARTCASNNRRISPNSG